MAPVHTKKDKLLDLLLHDPLRFEKTGGVDKLLAARITFAEIRELLKRIYDLNEAQLLKMSAANSGYVGALNKRSCDRRYGLFARKANRLPEDPIMIYAEGDSWFQFPVFVEDIIDHLNYRKNYLIYSDAYGGDWISNIIYESQYVTALTTYSSRFFLISGGGNDIVGSHRLGALVGEEARCAYKYAAPEEMPGRFGDAERLEVFESQRYLKKEFYALIQLLNLQYSLLLSKLYSKVSTQRDVITITQGYDFAIPHPGPRLTTLNPLQPILNVAMRSGNWLYTPLVLKGIRDPGAQRNLIKFLINEFNEMFCGLARKFDNVFHIDCRGLTRGKRDWFDELHLTNKNFRKVANAYVRVISDHESLLESGEKVVVVKDLA